MRICSIDPAFKNVGVAVINDKFELLYTQNTSFIAGYQKKNQTAYI